MSAREVLISILSNNRELQEIFLDNKQLPEIKFVEHKTNHTSYLIFVIDLQKDLTQISQRLIDTYSLCRETDSKLAVVILHGQKIDTEKNHYFQKMLDDLGKDKPLHRLVFTKDIYQHSSSTPSTPLDTSFYHSVTEKEIKISQKGDNLLFPLSLEDFTKAIVKILFLSNTSGKNFWILGDTITDLELAYLLKNNISSLNQEDPEINATAENDPQTKSLISIGTKSRGELNWQPENEIADDLRQIIPLYIDNPSAKENKKTKLNIIYRFLTWVYKPRPQKEKHLPTIRKIASKLLFAVLIISLLMGGVFIGTTSLSLQQLEKSVKHALDGNLKQSISSLNNAQKLKEIGESVFDPVVPLTNLIYPKGTEKIFNLYSFVDYGVQSLSNLHQTYVLAENFLISLNKIDNNTNYNDLSLALHSNLSQLYENINQIAFLSGGNKLPSFLDKKIKENPEFQNLKTLEEQLIQFIKVTDIIPAVFSGDKTSNILVLLQNNHILRPNGGKVDYYLLITLNKGKLISKKFYTDNELEKLYQDATPPTPKTNKKNTIPILKLQDLSENPDFSLAANNLALFSEKVLKIKPNFVIAANNLLLEQLLQEEKSAVLDQFKNDFTASSGATLYRDLTDQYIDRLFNQDISLPVIGRTIAKTIGDNQILIWSADNDTETLLASQSYSGVILSHPCNASIVSINNCIAETSYLSESAPEISRLSPWQNRLMSHNIKISSRSIQHEYKIDYKTKNNQVVDFSTTTTYHLYLPTPSTLDQLYLNDLPSSMKQVEKSTEGMFDYYKIPLIINPYQDIVVNIKATTGTNYNFSTPFSYSITEYRQPGTIDPGINLQITYLENLRPSIATSSFTSQPMQMILNLPSRTSSFGFTLVENIQ
ncbi:MAG TPA: DUF4012 domain-containing protein [Spirochaetia bacterium]|nr:DUF4012 domain-containing protein [Spirochaetia bacterium]